MRFNNDNETRGISFTFQSGPGFNISANFFTGIIMSKNELNYSNLEGKGVSIEAGYQIGLSYSVDQLPNPSYQIFTISYGVGYTEGSGNIMTNWTVIFATPANNCENCY